MGLDWIVIEDDLDRQNMISEKLNKLPKRTFTNSVGRNYKMVYEEGDVIINDPCSEEGMSGLLVIVPKGADKVEFSYDGGLSFTYRDQKYRICV
jgi:hypothetical protein